MGDKPHSVVLQINAVIKSIHGTDTREFLFFILKSFIYKAWEGAK